jgi:hypothetical protein
MNTHVSFDTHAFVKRLESSGMATAQAEALADALGDIVFETTATKSDLRELGLVLANDLKTLELKIAGDLTHLGVKIAGDLKDLEMKLSGNLKDLELRVMSRLGAVVAGSTALTIAILGALITLKG